MTPEEREARQSADWATTPSAASADGGGDHEVAPDASRPEARDHVDRGPQDVPPAPAPEAADRLTRTRAATAWASAVSLALVTVLFVVFVVQNAQTITVQFLWMDGHVAAAAALLIAAAAGALLVAIPAAVRIGQLRRALRRAG